MQLNQTLVMGFTLPKNYRSLSIEEKKEWNEIKRIFDQLGKVYFIKKGRRPILKDFLMINCKEQPTHIDTYDVKKESTVFQICLVQYQISYNTAHVYGGSTVTNMHKYLFGFTKQKMEVGKAYLRPESIGDKISEFFQPIELDIEGFEKFNRRYYLLANDKNKFLKAVDPEFLKFAAELNNLEMEFNGRNCLFRFNKSVDFQQAQDLCKVGIKMSEIKNNYS